MENSPHERIAFLGKPKSIREVEKEKGKMKRCEAPRVFEVTADLPQLAT